MSAKPPNKKAPDKGKNMKGDIFLRTLNRQPNTVSTYRWALSAYFSIAGEALSDSSYEKFWTDPHVKGMSESTKRVIRSSVMALFQYLDVGDIARRSKINDHYLRRAKTSQVYFDIDAVEKVIEHCSSLSYKLINLRDRAFVLLLADSGFRISELVGLNRGDIDFKRGQVVVIGKGDKQATIRMSKRSIEALKRYLSSRTTKLDGKSGQALGSLPLFAQHGRINKVKAMSVDGMRKAIKSRMKEAGAECRIHDFRHYFVTTVLRKSDNLKLAQELARHSNIQTTQRYAHLSDSELDASYVKIFNE